METAALWYVILGILLVVIAIATDFMKRLPLSAAVIYLAIGFGLGPYGAGMIRIDAVQDSGLLERITEVVVIVSLFAAGLKLRLPLRDPGWVPALRLAFLSLALTVAMIALFGVWFMHLSLGSAILLGAIVAPTDPVLAADVQVRGPEDPDQLRFSLTGEAGFNDGGAFPFVMLGLGILGLRDIGETGARWLFMDVVWACGGGLLIGVVLGTGTARLIALLRKRHHQRRREIIILDDFLALGLIALSYGVALLLHAYGFLAVFAAGLALRRIERIESGEKVPETKRQTLAVPLREAKAAIGEGSENTTAILAKAALDFDEQLERLGELGTVLLIGSMVLLEVNSSSDLWLIPFLFLVVRPICVWLGLAGSPTAGRQKGYIAWFGIRGIGSLYYLMYAIQNGLDSGLATRLANLTMMIVATSIIIHGISVTPLMNYYQTQTERRRRRSIQPRDAKV